MNWLDDVKYCAEECERQQSGEMSVYNMAFALHYARGTFNSAWTHPKQRTPLITRKVIHAIAKIVEPTKNTNECYRQTPVTINHRVVPFENIEHQMENLLSFQRDLNPTEWYKEFEEIHPFIDGNGRVGSILFNWLNNSLNHSVAPPDVFAR